MPSIFEQLRLRPAQCRIVAERRFDDANCLRKSGLNKHANGAMYLGGFVLECLLKAKLLERYTWLQKPPGDLSMKTADERKLFLLCYSKHDLTSILERLPDVQHRLAVASGRVGQPAYLLRSLKSLCAEWTIFARYSPLMATIGEAKVFLDRIKELKEWLK